MASQPLTFNLGTANYDLTNPLQAPANLGTAKNFPVGMAEVAVMLFVAGLGLALMAGGRKYR